ncbi:phenol hydroxylase subunit [Paraburkholderia sp.]|uniref:phenol hydroxylase subunit n=1 Tax=Paraburkholderia sp. TaxID=1926495 RepID=UPI0025FB217F|nr:phenol hydroxylase subunit [Paraburkholderia sp.]
MQRQTAEERFDPGRRFVKVTGINTRGFVEFEFSVGQPDLCVELMLLPAAFEEFCLAQNVSRLGQSSETMIRRSKQ